MTDEIKPGLNIPVNIVAAEEHRDLFKVGNELAPGKSYSRIVVQFPQTNPAFAPKTFVIDCEPEVVEEASNCGYDLWREAHPELNLPDRASVDMLNIPLVEGITVSRKAVACNQCAHPDHDGLHTCGK
jgi:hypothetical protein